jgi:CYTH domain-containing protein
LWVVDVFEGANAGLVMAEVELEQANENKAKDKLKSGRDQMS